MYIPKFDLTGKVAIVTGGGRGIGLAIAQTFAAYGAKVVIAEILEDICDKAAADIAKEFGVETLAVHTDVRKIADLDNMVAKTVEKFGKIDILVNNAGVGITKKIIKAKPDGDSFAIKDMLNEEEWHYVVDTDLKAVMFAAQRVVKVMIEKGTQGNIINIASVGGIVASSAINPYLAAKAGVIHMTKGMVLEWARYGIRINAIAPGYVRTPMTEGTLQNERAYNSITSHVPSLKKIGEPMDIAAAALYLASDAAEWTNGITIPVDGGRVVW
ncbi:MAG: SDR family oxidoreductase [Clostridia bacterium]|nr:SDR family oxidoreductase [Clostridia bacterium]MBQ1436209.1 SDR family oxidoreductase [Clostridia bacterium]